MSQTQDVLALRRAGVPPERIAEQLDISVEEVEEAVREALSTPHDGDTARQLELDRLDRMFAAVWPQVVAGDIAALDRALRISARRCKLLGLDLVPERPDAPPPSRKLVWE